MAPKAAETCQKKVSSWISPKKHLSWKMDRVGGVFDSALVRHHRFSNNLAYLRSFWFLGNLRTFGAMQGLYRWRLHPPMYRNSDRAPGFDEKKCSSMHVWDQNASQHKESCDEHLKCHPNEQK